MKLKPEHTGARVRKKTWPHWTWLDLILVGAFQVFAKDEMGKGVNFERDDNDKDWDLVSKPSPQNI